MFQTYQTKLKNEGIVLLNKTIESVCEYYKQYAAFLGTLERKLFVDLYVRNRSSGDLKKQYCAKYRNTSYKKA